VRWFSEIKAHEFSYTTYRNQAIPKISIPDFIIFVGKYFWMFSEVEANCT